MKKFLIVLLSLGLIAAFSMTASAADVKFSGSYYLVGVYESNDRLGDTGLATSRALFYQRVRLQPVFQIAEGLTFTVRMDALEKQWGQTDWRRGGAVAGGYDQTSSRPQVIAGGGTALIQENFEFERGYVSFKTAIGAFDVGYQNAGTWATAFADSGASRPRILYITAAGPVTLLAIYEKVFEADSSDVILPARYAGKADADAVNYALAGIYNFQGGNAGLLWYYITSAAGRVTAPPPAPDAGTRMKLHYLAPYVKATFGPVYVEAELGYTTGTISPDVGGTDFDMDGWAAYLLVKTNLGPGYFGAQFGWSSGDDGSDANKSKAFAIGGGADWNPALILMNDELNTWKYGTGTSTGNSGKGNMRLYQIFGGFNPTPKVNLQAALTVAQVDKIPAAAAFNRNDSKALGTEFDITATYKLYDNLSYMVGAGYLWTGDAFKGYGVNSNANVVGNDYLLMNRLSLSF